MYKLIAHRGDKKSSKENTMAAFFDAINSDFVGFECDVKMTKDEKFVIWHDPLIEGKLLKSYTFNELKRYNLPSLEEVLNINTKKIILIDIKDYKINTNKFLKIINKHSRKNIYIMSFFNSIIEKLNISDRRYKIGILNYALNTNKEHFLYDFIGLPNMFVSSQIINNFKKNNKLLFIYGIKSSEINHEYPYYIVD